jgi:hypothetical protein
MNPMLVLAIGVAIAAGGAVLLIKQVGPTHPTPALPVAEVRGQPISAPTAPSQSAIAKEAVAPTAAVAAAPAVTAAPAVPATPVPAAKSGDDFAAVGFDRLAAFTYDVPDESKGPQKVEAATKTGSQIPETIRALNNHRVALKGFMLPLKVEGGLITEMLIMQNQSMCCYGTTPRINEWVSVRMNGKGVKPIMDQVVTLYGTLKVGEIRENGYLVGIYEMVGEKMAGPLDL